MKYFTEPTGKFVLKLPTEWQYKNVAVRIEEKPPFSFELYENSIGAFQISCYSGDEKHIPLGLKVQEADAQNLDFVKARMDDDEHNIHLWYAVVEDHLFMAKYIYDCDKETTTEIISELKKAEKTLATLMFISQENRREALDTDRYEKFMAALSASFDLREKAIKNKSVIEFVVITANQIDAYLRMSLVLTFQINNHIEDVEMQFLYQGESDKAIMERRIFKMARDADIIDTELFDRLESLYKERNKMVHRYIISDFKTRDLYQIAFDYDDLCEEVRLLLKAIEDEQHAKGIYGNSQDSNVEPSHERVNLLFSQVNDKHLDSEFQREIHMENDTKENKEKSR